MIHRDNKPANIFLTIDNDVKIGDFGLTLSTVGKKSIQLTKDSGSIFYNSVETNDDSKYSHKADIWSVSWVYVHEFKLMNLFLRSLVVTFYELSVLKHPFYFENKPIRKVLNDISEIPFVDLPNDYFSQLYNSLIKR